MGFEEKRTQSKKIAEIIGSESGEIVSYLKRKQSTISKEDILNAAKTRQNSIVSQLREAGLSDKEIKSQLSWVGRLVLIKLKKEMGEDAIRGMAADRLDDQTSSNMIAQQIVKVSKDRGIDTSLAKKKLSSFHSELKFREQLVKKIEEAIYDMTGVQYDVSTVMKQYMTLEKPFSVTRQCEGKNYDVILKEFIPKNFYDPALLKVAGYMNINEYKIKTFRIKGAGSSSKDYAVIEKVPGKNIIYLKMNPRQISGLERQYLRELGKIVAFTYACAIPDRTSNNIIFDKKGYEIKLTTFDFAKSLDYRKYPPVKVALVALDMSVPFSRDIAQKNKDALRNGFIEAFNLAKENESKILECIEPLKDDAVAGIKEIMGKNPGDVFNEIISKSKIFSE